MLRILTILVVASVALCDKEPPNCAWKPRATVDGLSCCLRESIPGCACMHPPEEIPADTGAAVCGRTGGGCPVLHPLIAAGICVEECTTHTDCSDNQMCCSNGCGHTCKDPEPIVTVDNYECPDIRCSPELGCDGSGLKKDSNGCPMCECQGETTTAPSTATRVVDSGCKGGMVWNDCGSPCTATCDDPTPMCIEMCEAKCECPFGQVWHNEQCQDPSVCDTTVNDDKCSGGQEWFECGMACTATCDEPNPMCNRMCVSRCQCPSEKPILHLGQCIEESQCSVPEPPARCPDKCPSGQTCQQEEVRCVRAPCPKIWSCLPEPEMPCAMPMCTMRCVYGYALDARGCMTCDCRSTPESNCPFELCTDSCGYTIDEYGCKKCTPCSKECPMIKCVANCDYGYTLDEQGCRTCDCVPPPHGLVCAEMLCGNTCPFGRRQVDRTRHCPVCECKGLGQHALIGVAVAGAVVLIVAIVILTVCCCRSSRKRQGKYNMIVAAMTNQPAYEKMRENSVSFKAAEPKADISVGMDEKPVHA